MHMHYTLSNKGIFKKIVMNLNAELHVTCTIDYGIVHLPFKHVHSVKSMWICTNVEYFVHTQTCIYSVMCGVAPSKTDGHRFRVRIPAQAEAI